MRCVWAVASVVVGLGVATPQGAAAEQRLYVIAIGHNRPPSGGGEASELQPLRFADDDAAAFHAFARGYADHSYLLSVLDARSQRRFPSASEVARPPTFAELDSVVSELADRIEADRREGHQSHVWLFYSGHGTRPRNAEPSLTLLDGKLTREVLYEDMLAPLRSRYIHLFVDACHAEAVVQPRDGGGEVSADVVEVTERDIRRWASRKTLRRFPRVGAVMAASGDRQTHEWDRYEHGVFTHQLLSGLRGAADVNLDGRIEYSELHGFLTAANREVDAPRARLDVVVQPPRLRVRVPIVDLRRNRRSAWLTDLSTKLDHFHVEDERGRRIVDAHLEAGHTATITVPAGRSLHLRTPRREAVFRLERGQAVSVRALRLRARTSRRRGAVAASFRRGLFEAAFGPLYYRGFADRRQAAGVSFDDGPWRPGASLEPSPEPATAGAAPIPKPDEPRPAPSRVPAAVAFAGAGALLAGAAASAGVMVAARRDFHGTELERPAAEARDRYRAARIGLFATAAGSAVAAGLGLWLWPWNADSPRDARLNVTASPAGTRASLRLPW